MVDSITKVNTDEELDILDKLVEHTESTSKSVFDFISVKLIPFSNR